MTKITSVKWRNKEVQNPFLRKLIILCAVTLIPLMLMVSMILLVFMIPIMIALHPFFRLFGRAGTIRPGQIALDRESFKRVR